VPSRTGTVTLAVPVLGLLLDLDALAIGAVALTLLAVRPRDGDVDVKKLPMRQVRFALTSAMCLAVAAQIDGTVVAECASPARAAGGLPKERSGSVRLAHPSGVLPVAADVATRDGAPWAERVTVYRTARRLMEGFVRVP